MDNLPSDQTSAEISLESTLNLLPKETSQEFFNLPQEIKDALSDQDVWNFKTNYKEFSFEKFYSNDKEVKNSDFLEKVEIKDGLLFQSIKIKDKFYGFEHRSKYIWRFDQNIMRSAFLDDSQFDIIHGFHVQKLQSQPVYKLIPCIKQDNYSILYMNSITISDFASRLSLRTPSFIEID